jgi:hypothetical protein
MSRAYKDQLADEIADLGGTGFATVANVEQLSGADLEQARLTVLNGDTATINAAGTKTLGVNSAFTGNPNSAALTGADLERFAGSQ